MKHRQSTASALKSIQLAITMLEMPYPAAPRLVRGRAIIALNHCREALEKLEPPTSTEGRDDG